MDPHLSLSHPQTKNYPGLGKTVAALAYAAHSGQKAIVVCPKSVRSTWVKNATHFFPEYFQNHTTVELGGDSPCHKMTKEDIVQQISTSRLVCLNYEALPKYLPMVLESGVSSQCLILDESHLLKNGATNRTQAILGCSSFFESRTLLSGTPVKNRATDWESQLKIVGCPHVPDLDVMTFGAVWNLLQEKGLILSTTAQEEFPHLRYHAEPNIIDVTLQIGDVHDLNTYSEDGLLGQIHEKLMATAVLKAPATAELAEKLTADPADKAIIFTERVECALYILELLEKERPGSALLHTGKVKANDSEWARGEFSRVDGECRILVATRQSLGLGINLPGANVVLFNDLAWSPADIIQAASRAKRAADRSSLKREVKEIWMRADTVFDTNLSEVLREKLALMKMCAEGKNVTTENQVWMHKAADMYEIAGIERPKRKKKTKRKQGMHPADSPGVPVQRVATEAPLCSSA